jgi:hypothetical protein
LADTEAMQAGAALYLTKDNINPALLESLIRAGSACYNLIKFLPFWDKPLRR